MASVALNRFLIFINQGLTGLLLVKKTKSFCTPAICKSSLWYTCCAHAPAKTHKHGSADTHGCTNIHTHTHTPLHSSKVHLSRWQLDSCWGGVCQAESLAYLVGARTSWETFWHTEAAEPSCMCLCLCMHVCVNAQLFKTPSSTIARSSPSSVSACAWQGQTWQGAAHFVRLPVNIKSAYCSRLYLNTFPLLPFYSQLFTCLPYDISKGFLPIGWKECTVSVFFQTALQQKSTRNASMQWCNWVFLWENSRQILFSRHMFPQRSHVWSSGKILSAFSQHVYILPDGCPIIQVLATSLHLLFPGF